MRLIHTMVGVFLLVTLSGCDVFKAAFSDDANAIVTAKYDVMGQYLKNPDSAYFEKETVHGKYKYTDQKTGTTNTKYFVSFDVTAANSFGGKVKTGYCLVLSLTSDKKYLVDVPPKECARGGPTSDEIKVIKSLANWNEGS